MNSIIHFIFSFSVIILKIFFYLFHSKKKLIILLLATQKQLQILQRQSNKKISILSHEKLFFVLFIRLYKNIKKVFYLFRPETLLNWNRKIIQKRWYFKKKNISPGRPPVAIEIKKLILNMKNDNLLWGAKKIQGELTKLGIILHKSTIQKILATFRKNGKIKSALTWKKFLISHINSLFAMDFFTVDAFFNKRFYLFFIISHKTREIIQFAITQHPTKEFVKQQLVSFEENIKQSVYLIHDNSGEFFLNYSLYNIKDAAISPRAPNMNAIAERFVGSIRREALDFFIVFNEQQLRNIIKQFVNYYNSLLPHQGINQDIPLGYTPQTVGDIYKKQILSGICHHYFRDAA